MKIARGKDKEVVRVIEKMKKARVKVLQEDEWQIEEDLELKEGKVYILKDKALKVKTTQLHHDVSIAEHGGRQKTTKFMTRNYQWSRVTRDVEEYINKCDMCQKMKNQIEVLEFITKLLLIAGKDTILVVCNKLSKITYFVTTIKGTLAEGLGWLFRNKIWKLYVRATG